MCDSQSLKRPSRFARGDSCHAYIRGDICVIPRPQSESISKGVNEKEDKSERRMPRLSGGDEGRGKLRKVAGICKQDLILE